MTAAKAEPRSSFFDARTLRAVVLPDVPVGLLTQMLEVTLGQRDGFFEVPDAIREDLRGNPYAPGLDVATIDSSGDGTVRLTGVIRPSWVHEASILSTVQRCLWILIENAHAAQCDAMCHY